MMIFKRQSLILLGFLWLAPSVSFAEVVPTEVISRSGIKAWLIQDDKLPLVSFRFAFKGGVEYDPEDKQGLAVLATSLLTQGAGPYDDQAFQQKLAENSISLSVSAGRDAIEGEFKTLSRSKKEAFRLLGLALAKPRVDGAVLDRARQQQMTAIKMQSSQPSWQGRRALFGALFDGHPYSYRSLGTRASLEGIAREDVLTFLKARMSKHNLVVAVVGDISQSELREALDAVFGFLPEASASSEIGEAKWLDPPRSILVKREGTQTTSLFALPMMRRDDPDWYAAEIANYILGGGSFLSRLMKEVRAQEGLTYGIGTSLAPMDKASILMGSLSTDNDKTAAAWALVLKVWQAFYDEGVTAEEIQAAKDYLAGSLPLSLTSTDALSEALLSMQLKGFPRDYLAFRAKKIYQTKDEDVSRVIKDWYNPARLTAVFVGQPVGLAVDQEQQTAEE